MRYSYKINISDITRQLLYKYFQLSLPKNFHLSIYFLFAQLMAENAFICLHIFQNVSKTLNETLYD